MSTIYRAKSGETYELLAKRFYGSDNLAYRIREANPGTIEPFLDGVSITIPSIPEQPSTVQRQTIAGQPDEVAILINGKRFRYWTSVTVTRAIDAVSTVSISSPYDSDSVEIKEALRPFSFQTLEVTIGGELIFTGTLVEVTPVMKSGVTTLQGTAYGLPGALMDCTAPASAYDGGSGVSFYNSDLKEIATKVAGLLGIKVRFDSDPGAKFSERIALKPTKKIWGFLVDLAQQKELILRDDVDGTLVFWQPERVAGEPRAVLAQGSPPLVSVSPEFSPQQYYSHVTGRLKPIFGMPSLTKAATVKNPSLSGVLRPFTFEATDTSHLTVQQAAEAKAGRMFASAAHFPTVVATWRDAKGDLWQPGTEVSLHAPDSMIYNPYRFIVRNVELTRTRDTTTALLGLTIPEGFTAGVPEVLPWDL